MLKKNAKYFLIISLVLSYIAFGIIAYSRISFDSIFNNFPYLILLILGFLSPIISSAAVYLINKDHMDGFKGLIDELKRIKAPKAVALIPLFLITHYGFNIIFKNVYKYGDITDFFRYLPAALILLGTQEIGWRSIVQPYFEEKNGFLRSIIITGLFWSLWFLPLIYIPGFMIPPQVYAQFAAYLVGIGALSTTLYKKSGSILYCIILSGLIFAMYPVVIVKQSMFIVLVALLEIMIYSVLKEKAFN